MKLASYRWQGRDSFGIVAGGGVIDLGGRLGPVAPDLRAALATGELGRLARFAELSPDLGLDEIAFLPVVPRPDKIFCIGVNYRSHLEETGRPTPEKPMVFTRFANSQVGHGQAMIRPHESVQFDFEGELAVVIGKAGRRIPPGRALAHVAGYACYNDGSVRDWQRHTSQFTPGKNFPATGAFGPWLVTTDEMPDPSALTLVTRLNGVEMQRASTGDLVFGVATLIAYLSSFTELVPGDVVVTGTTGGVGAFRTPPLWMQPGDRVEVEISGIGVLANPVVAED